MRSTALRRRGLLVVLSDFYDDEDATLAELRRARAMGHDVVDVPGGDADRARVPVPRATRGSPMSSRARRVAANGTAIRSAYRDAFAAFLERWRARTRGEGIDYTLLVTDAPLDEAIRGFLLRRHGMLG